MKGVTAYCRINKTGFSYNGNQVALSEPGINNIYKSLELKYPKFYKMDRLSKVSLLGVEILKKENPSLSTYKDDEIALLFANSESSAVTDLKFQKSYKEDGNASPSLFVYTLPNIALGEIAIKNKWFGESLFFISPKFDSNQYDENVITLFHQGSKACICGWVNVLEEEFDAFFFLIEKNNDDTSVNLLDLYNS